MNSYRSVRAVLAGAAVIALAGCGASASTAGGASLATAAGTPGSTQTSTSPGASPGTNASARGGAISTSASVPFPVAVGNTWLYKTTVVLVGETGTTTDKIVSVAPTLTGHLVTMSYVRDLAGNTNTADTTYLFYSDGKIAWPLTQLPDGVSADGSGIVWPDAAAIASGRTYRSVLRIHMLEASETLSQTSNITVRGAGTVSVTVPAGTYRATLVDMTMTAEVAGIATTIEVKTWVAKGIGPVKSEALIHTNGHTEITTVDELKSFTKG
jgi:hypothetical protein